MYFSVDLLRHRPSVCLRLKGTDRQLNAAWKNRTAYWRSVSISFSSVARLSADETTVNNSFAIHSSTFYSSTFHGSRRALLEIAWLRSLLRCCHFGSSRLRDDSNTERENSLFREFNSLAWKMKLLWLALSVYKLT